MSWFRMQEVAMMFSARPTKPPCSAFFGADALHFGVKVPSLVDFGNRVETSKCVAMLRERRQRS
jgi:hypothetical protein